MLAATAALILGSARRARAADAVRVALSASEEGSVLYTASARGSYKDAGIDAAGTVVAPNQMIEGVIGGAFDVGISNTGAILLAHDRGLPLYLVAPGAEYTTRQPISRIVVALNSPIRTAKDFNGKTIGVFAIHDMASTALLQWLDMNGADSKSVHFLEVPPLAQQPALLAGRIDGAIMVEPHFSDARGTLREVGLTYAAVARGKPFLTTAVVANKAWADANPGVLRRFTGAVHQTAQWDNRNPDAAAPYIATLMKIDLAVVTAIPRVRWGESPAPPLVQPVIDMMAKYGILTRSFPAQELAPPAS